MTAPAEILSVPKPAWAADDVGMLYDLAHRFMSEEIAPRYDEFEKNEIVDRESWLKAGRAGLLCASMPEKYGGSGGTFAHESAIIEAIGHVGVDGFGIGLAVTLVPLYISEIAPSEIRGRLNTLPQFSGSGGMFLSYCMVFGMSLLPSPDWRVMLGVLSVPSLFFFGLTVFFLPESPRWLVSKGRMAEAKKVLQRLRGREDVSGLLFY
jgi:MFS family permease